MALSEEYPVLTSQSKVVTDKGQPTQQQLQRDDQLRRILEALDARLIAGGL